MFKNCAKTLETMRSELHTHTQQKGIAKPSTEKNIAYVLNVAPGKCHQDNVFSTKDRSTILPPFKHHIKHTQQEVTSFSSSPGHFPTQGSNPGLLYHRQILYHPSHLGSLRNLIDFFS